MVEYLDLTVDDLLLDINNPRLGAVRSQSEALETLIQLNQSNFRILMLSIKNNGIDPGDSFYVIEVDEDDYIVLEGNRRLSALKVLCNPDVLDGTDVSASIKKSLRRAASGFNRDTVEPIRCVLFDEREDANDWIQRRHTGGADGEGRIQWGPLEVQRFSGDRSILDVIDFVGRNADYSDEDWESTKSMIESRKSSNLARLLESSPGQKHLGISIAKGSGEKTPMLSSEPKWALKVLTRIIEDVRDGVIDSRDLNKAADIGAYFKSLPARLQPKKSANGTPRAFKEINLKADDSGSTKGKKATPKTTSTPRLRKALSPKKHPFKAPGSTKGQRLLREAGMLDADNFTIASAFVLRAFVELAINDYMQKNGLPKKEQNAKGNMTDLDLSQRAERVIKHIVNSDPSANADLRGFRNNITKRAASSSIQSLNGFVHNKFQIPTPEALRTGWDSSVPIFVAAYGAA